MTYEIKPSNKFVRTVNVPMTPGSILMSIETREQLYPDTLRKLWRANVSGGNKTRQFEEVDLLREFIVKCQHWKFTQREIGEALHGTASYGRRLCIKFGSSRTTGVDQ